MKKIQLDRKIRQVVVLNNFFAFLNLWLDHFTRISLGKTKNEGYTFIFCVSFQNFFSFSFLCFRSSFFLSYKTGIDGGGEGNEKPISDFNQI